MPAANVGPQPWPSSTPRRSGRDAVTVVLLTCRTECDIRDEMGTTLSRMRSGDEA